MASTAKARTSSKLQRVARQILLGFAAVLGLTMIGFLIWANTGVMEAEPGPLAAVKDDPAMIVTDHKEAIVLAPAEGDSDAGFVFIPGAKVAAEAYVSNLSGIVEDGNVTVVITKPTLHLAFFDLRPLETFTDLAPSMPDSSRSTAPITPVSGTTASSPVTAPPPSAAARRARF